MTTHITIIYIILLVIGFVGILYQLVYAYELSKSQKRIGIRIPSSIQKALLWNVLATLGVVGLTLVLFLITK